MLRAPVFKRGNIQQLTEYITITGNNSNTSIYAISNELLLVSYAHIVLRTWPKFRVSNSDQHECNMHMSNTQCKMLLPFYQSLFSDMHFHSTSLWHHVATALICFCVLNSAINKKSPKSFLFIKSRYGSLAPHPHYHMELCCT